MQSNNGRKYEYPSLTLKLNPILRNKKANKTAPPVNGNKISYLPLVLLWL